MDNNFVKAGSVLVLPFLMAGTAIAKDQSEIRVFNLTGKDIAREDVKLCIDHAEQFRGSPAEAGVINNVETPDGTRVNCSWKRGQGLTITLR